MEIDFRATLGKTIRRASSCIQADKSVRVLTIIRDFDSTLENVWDALTNSLRIPNWFLPIKGELVLGGRFQLQGSVGGEILVCDPPRRFQMTWEYGEELSWVDVSLLETVEGVLFTLEHIVCLPEDKWREYGPGAVGVGIGDVRP